MEGKVYTITSQRDLVTTFGTPIFQTTSSGAPLNADELNEYGLLAAYSLLGVTNRCYVLRADIDLASLKSEFLKLQQQYHPDKAEDKDQALIKSSEINQAFKVLSHVDSRAGYLLALKKQDHHLDQSISDFEFLQSALEIREQLDDAASTDDLVSLKKEVSQWIDGLVRMAPPLETHAFGHTISWNILIPGLIVPGILFTGMALYPFIESWMSGDKREHHLLDRPRNAPNRTALGAMSIAFILVVLLNGGNDLIATHFHLSINSIMWFTRIGVLVIPPLVFVITKRICLSLQRADREKVLHGRETGRLVMLPHGEFVEVHEELSPAEKWVLTSHEQAPALTVPEEDSAGVRNPQGFKGKLRARFSKANAEQIPAATQTEAKELDHH